MITLQELCLYLSEVFNPELFNDYCPNGLQVQGKNEVKKIGTAVSASLATIEEAVKRDVQALIVHHGLFWKNDPYVVTGTKQQKLKLLLKNEISLFAFHLPMDAHVVIGNNWKVALDLGWEQCQPFGQFDGSTIGVKGVIKPTDRVLLKKKLSDYYQHEGIEAFGGKEIVKTIALISGGAYKSVSEAAKEEIDCFITGNFDEPAWHIAHEESINFLAYGHSATERIGPKALRSSIEKDLQVTCDFIDIFNPF